MDDNVILEMKIFRAAHPAYPPESELTDELKKLRNCMERMHGVVCHMIRDVESITESLTTQAAAVAPNPADDKRALLTVLQGSRLPETPSAYPNGQLEVSGSHTCA